MSTFKHQKNFFHRYGHLIGYENDDLLYWYFSYPDQPTPYQVNAEIDRRLAAKNSTGWHKRQRKNYRRNSRKCLYNQLVSVAERTELLYQDKFLGIEPHDSLAVAPIQLPIIRQLRQANPGIPVSRMKIQIGQLVS